MNTARVRTSELVVSEENYYSKSYVNNPIREDNQVIEGYFQKEISQKAMAIRKVNKTLCGLLGIAVIVAFIGYYFAMSNELTLNDENAELQNQLDRLKSFNNVDSKMMQYNMLQKAAKVIEVPAVHSAVTVDKKPEKTAAFNWAIGY